MIVKTISRILDINTNIVNKLESMGKFLAKFTLFGYLTAMHSISTSAPFGRAFTAKAERAGKGALKVFS